VTRAGAAARDALALHDAQLVIARENGFPSWSKLKAQIGADTVERPLLLAAQLMAANRAAETMRRAPLYRDPLAGDLAGDDGWAALEAVRQGSWPGYASGPDPYLTILTRYFDDALVEAVRKTTIRQVVIVGAGMDTRAFRLAWPSGIHLFEVDTADVFAYKEPILHRLGAQPLCQRHTACARSYVSLARALRRTTFDPALTTAFLIERLQYLSPQRADRLLRELSALASERSWLGLALVSHETLHSNFMKPLLRKFEGVGLPPWTFGVDDPETWLAQYGWTGGSVVAGAPEASFGRWPYGYVPRGTPAIPRGFFTIGWKSRKEDSWPSSQ
jgi:methyltransferase (TIGR00027 family)